MSAVNSYMLPLGTSVPDFRLPDASRRDFPAKVYSPADFKEAPALLIAVICNHCPYVRHVIDAFSALAGEYRKKGLAVVAISPNDVTAYPEDAPENMAAFAAEHGFTFPYLYDDNQETAAAFQAACTPDFYLFDGNRRLAYRGRMDDSSPGNGRPVTGADLRAALDAVLAGKPAPAEQKPSIGCSIKWKPGLEPSYVSAPPI